MIIRLCLLLRTRAGNTNYRTSTYHMLFWLCIFAYFQICFDIFRYLKTRMFNKDAIPFSRCKTIQLTIMQNHDLVQEKHVQLYILNLNVNNTRCLQYLKLNMLKDSRKYDLGQWKKRSKPHSSPQTYCTVSFVANTSFIYNRLI